VFLQEEVPDTTRRGAKQTDSKQADQRIANRAMPGHAFSKGIESLGEVLRPDKKGKENTGPVVVRKHGSQRDRFRDEIHQHCHELCFAAGSFGDLGIEDAKDESAKGTNGCNCKCRKIGHAWRNECERDGSNKNSSSESDDSVHKLALPLGFGCALEQSNDASQERGKSCQP
jgi:hypothetical protein